MRRKKSLLALTLALSFLTFALSSCILPENVHDRFAHHGYISLLEDQKLALWQNIIGNSDIASTGTLSVVLDGQVLCSDVTVPYPGGVICSGKTSASSVFIIAAPEVAVSGTLEFGHLSFKPKMINLGNVTGLVVPKIALVVTDETDLPELTNGSYKDPTGANIFLNGRPARTPPN